MLKQGNIFFITEQGSGSQITKHNKTAFITGFYRYNKYYTCSEEFVYLAEKIQKVLINRATLLADTRFHTRCSDNFDLH